MSSVGAFEPQSVDVGGHLSCLSVRPVLGLQKLGLIEALLAFSGLAPSARWP